MVNDEISSLNAILMSPEINYLAGDCPDCGTPKYKWTKAMGEWHCPTCHGAFAVDGRKVPEQDLSKPGPPGVGLDKEGKPLPAIDPQFPIPPVEDEGPSVDEFEADEGWDDEDGPRDEPWQDSTYDSDMEDEEAIEEEPPLEESFFDKRINREPEEDTTTPLSESLEDEGYTLDDAKDILVDYLEDMDFDEAFTMASEGLSPEDTEELRKFMDQYKQGPKYSCECGWEGDQLNWTRPYGPNRGYGEGQCPQCHRRLDFYDSTD